MVRTLTGQNPEDFVRLAEKTVLLTFGHVIDQFNCHMKQN